MVKSQTLSENCQSPTLTKCPNQICEDNRCYIDYSKINKKSNKLKNIIRFMTTIIRLKVCCDVPNEVILKYMRREIIFPHPIGIVIGRNVKLGNNLIIYQNVTLGGIRANCSEDDYPEIADNIILYAGCCVVGNIIITRNVRALEFIRP